MTNQPQESAEQAAEKYGRPSPSWRDSEQTKRIEQGLVDAFLVGAKWQQAKDAVTIAELKAENARLENQSNEDDIIRKNLRIDNQKLRDALEEIKSTIDGKLCSPWINEDGTEMSKSEVRMIAHLISIELAKALEASE